jgi:phosphatidylserine/phosphatidylglycerophosphate/cardiolipin synthase-like enzyme
VGSRKPDRKWLLPADPRSWRLAQLPGEVEVYVLFESYCVRLGELIGQAREGDEIFIAGWEFEFDKVLLSAQGAQKQSAADMLDAAAQRKVKIRILANQAIAMAVKSTLIEKERDFQIFKNFNHHQKAVYLRIKDSHFFFVGGMDLEIGGKENPRPCWFDVMLEIRGRAAEFGLWSLEERWASVRGTVVGPRPGAADWSQPENCVLQFVRSYSKDVPPADSKGRKRSYKSDSSYLELLQNVIRNAKTSIYIEDQFFMATKGLDSLIRERLANRVTLVVVTTPAKTLPEGLQKRGGHQPLADELSLGRPNVHIFQTKWRPPPARAYVHSKTWIVDDEVVLIGSGNYWEASMQGLDTELGGAVVSTREVNGLSFAHDLRVRLWDRLISSHNPKASPVKPQGSIRDEVTALDQVLERIVPQWSGPPPGIPWW